MKKIATILMAVLLICSCAVVSHAATIKRTTPDNELNPTKIEYRLEIKENEPAGEKQKLLSFVVNEGEVGIPFNLFLYNYKLWFGDDTLKSYSLEKYGCMQMNNKPVTTGVWILQFYDGELIIMQEGAPTAAMQMIKCANTNYQMDISQFLIGQISSVTSEETEAVEKSTGEYTTGQDVTAYTYPENITEQTSPSLNVQQDAYSQNDTDSEKQKLSVLEIVLLLIIVMENVALIVFFALRKKKADNVPVQPTKRDDDYMQKTTNKRAVTVTYPSPREKDAKQEKTKPSRVYPARQRSGQADAKDVSADPFAASVPSFSLDLLKTKEDQPPIEDSYVSPSGSAKKSASSAESVQQQINEFYTGKKSPDASSLRIEPLEITNFQQMRFSPDEKPVFKVIKDLDATSFVIVEGIYVCLNFYRFSGQQFKAYGDIQGLKNCFDIVVSDGSPARAQNQPIYSLTPGKATLSGMNYQLTEKGRLNLGV